MGYYFKLESFKHFKNNCECTQLAIVLGNILIIKVIRLRLIKHFSKDHNKNRIAKYINNSW